MATKPSARGGVAIGAEPSWLVDGSSGIPQAEIIEAKKKPGRGTEYCNDALAQNDLSMGSFAAGYAATNPAIGRASIALNSPLYEYIGICKAHLDRGASPPRGLYDGPVLL